MQLNARLPVLYVLWCIESTPHWVYILNIRYELHQMDQTDLVNDGKDSVDEHQVLLLERQVVGLLQGKQHRPYQSDLGGAKMQ